MPDSTRSTSGGSTFSRLRVPEQEDLPVEVRELVTSRQENLGFVPNVMRAFALQPGHLLGWWRYFSELMRGESSSTLTELQREMIAVVVSAENDCHY